MKPTSWLEINLTALDANVAAFRQLLDDEAKTHGRTPALLCGVVKADAYGLGAGPIARRLAGKGADMLAVYSPAQAEQLLAHNVPCPILVLMPTHELSRSSPLYRAVTTGRLHLAVHDPEQLANLERFGQLQGIDIPVHLHIDTGMSRAGLTIEQAGEMIGRLDTLKHVQVVGVYTHFATADSDADFVDEQTDRLNALLEAHRDALAPETLIHAANTYATLRDGKYHGSMVRVGLGLYGYGADEIEGEIHVAATPVLRHAVRWLSRIGHVGEYPRGATVGYDRTFRLRRKSRLGVVPVGYGDGYPLALAGKAMVRLSGLEGDDQQADVPVLGRVSMDQIVIDLTDAPHARVDTLVEVVSDDPDAPCSVPAIAALTRSHCYEVLCRIGKTVPRVYVAESERATE